MDKEVLFIMIKGVTYQEVISPKVCVLFNDFEYVRQKLIILKKEIVKSILHHSFPK